MQKATRISVVISLILVCVQPGWAQTFDNEKLPTPGLLDSVEIIKDRWGISHIYAKNQKDLFFAQGYSAARDRLFQFEIWRRRALGLMAEIQGEKALQHDIGARLLKFRGDMRKEMHHYHKDGEEIINAFVKGVNAYIDTVLQKPELLPMEFELLGIKPGHWTPEIVISRHNALTGGASQEVMIARLLQLVGEEKTRQIMPFRGNPYLKPREGVALEEMHDNILAVYKASRNPPAFSAEDLSPQVTAATPVRIERLNTDLDAFSNPVEYATVIGSNNWVISGNKTANGYPVMADDPHRRIQTPSLRYWAHLVAPGWNVIGGGEPVLPGISIGHNDYGAWGLTIFPIDQEDIYVYQTNPRNPNQYLYDGKWVDMEVVTEQIPVKNQPDFRAPLKYTRHGPVIYEDKHNNKAYGLKAAWLDIGAAPYLASLRMDQAQNWSEFRAACAWSGLPGENMVWADKQGNIGWQAVGLTPLRIGWDGVLPVPGDGRYEWAGYAPIKSLPHILNPKKGFWHTANYYNVPENYPNIFSFISAGPARSDRISEVLAQDKKHSVGDSMSLQQDVLSVVAREIVPVLKGVTPSRSETRAAKARLLQWNYRMEKDSAAAAIYAVWEKELLDTLTTMLMPADQTELLSLAKEKMVEWLQHPEMAPRELFGDKSEVVRNNLLIENLDRAVEKLSAKQGADPENWKYGSNQFRYSKMEHPLSHLLDRNLQTKLDAGPVPTGGDSNTVNVNHGAANQTAGASFRIIVDTGNWDASKGTNTPGQSGNPDSPHYKDLFQMWAEGKYFPVYFTRKKIERAASLITRLVPKS